MATRINSLNSLTNLRYKRNKTHIFYAYITNTKFDIPLTRFPKKSKTKHVLRRVFINRRSR